MEQKTQQLCRQVQRALNLALGGQLSGDVLDAVFIVGVSTAAGGCGRLLVHVEVPANGLVCDVMAELRNRTPQLRAVVAGYISRKRAPELSFVIAPSGGSEHG